MYKYQRLYFNNKLIMKSFLSFASRISMFNFFNIGHSSIYPNLVGKSNLGSSNYPTMTNGDLIDVLDNQGIRTGEVLSRKEIHNLGKPHRAVHLYLFDMDDNILLQRRPSDVDHYPGMLSISLTGHVESGEFSQQALKREIKEELGISANDLNINFIFSFRQYVKIREDYIDKQFNDVYFCRHDFVLKDIKFNPQEVSELKLIHFS